MKTFFWAAYSDESRHTTLEKIKKIINKYGDIVDFKFFSDVSLTIVIEVKELEIDQLYIELASGLGIDSVDPLNSSLETERTVYLNVNFAHGTGSFTVEVPSVPG